VGPSEILVICDGTTDPDWVAMDLFSQAEHDELAQSILLCPDAGYLAAEDFQLAFAGLGTGAPVQGVLEQGGEAAEAVGQAGASRSTGRLVEKREIHIVPSIRDRR